MDKRNAFEIVNDEFSKIARFDDFVGGIGAGAILGGTLGNYGGKGLAKIVTPMNSEMKLLSKENKNKRKELKKIVNKVDRNAFDTDEFVLNLKTNPNYNNLSVEDVNNLAKDYYTTNFAKVINELNNEEKTANEVSGKAMALGALIGGVPAAGVFGVNGFKKERERRTDTQSMKDENDIYDEAISKYKNNDVPFEDFIHKSWKNRGYSEEERNPYHYLSNAMDDERPYFAGQLNKGLIRKGIDINKMNFKQYDDMVDNYIENYYQTGDESTSRFLRRYANKL